jgi:hypothetical protein
VGCAHGCAHGLSIGWVDEHPTWDERENGRSQKQLEPPPVFEAPPSASISKSPSLFVCVGIVSRLSRREEEENSSGGRYA